MNLPELLEDLLNNDTEDWSNVIVSDGADDWDLFSLLETLEEAPIKDSVEYVQDWRVLYTVATNASGNMDMTPTRVAFAWVHKDGVMRAPMYTTKDDA